MPTKNSIIWFFIVGTLLLVLPLVLVVLWGSPLCIVANAAAQVATDYCPSTTLFKKLIEFFPFLMIIGAVIIGYNLKRISDSMLPPAEEADENDALISHG